MTKNRNRILSFALMTASPLALVLAATPAVAQERAYDIKAQPLSSAILEYGRQSGVTVVAPIDLMKGKNAPAVRGNMTPSEALDRLLAGSGLRAVRRPNGAITVVQGGNGQGADARPNVSQSNTQFVDVPAASASTVVDARTGAALKGALVEITETGEKTSTGDLGEFRFPGKSGSFNLRVSYLGYPQYEQFVDLKDGRATSGILLSDGSAVGEIVVTAYQSARAQALNQERTAENAQTVISADLLGQFDGATISDALRRAPGVAFTPNPETGEGSNVIIRGLAPDYNTVTLNGLRLPVGNGQSRSASLNNLLADSISKVTINKTLLPNQDGSGTGGLVEIETKSPLDRPRRYANLAADWGETGRSFARDYSVAGTVSALFGRDEQFGVSASVQYRKLRNERLSFTNATTSFGQYLPATDGGRPVSGVGDIDPRREFPYEDGVVEAYSAGIGTGFNHLNQSDLAVTLSAAAKLGTHTTLRLDFNRADQNKDTFSRSFSFGQIAGYEPLPVAELNGEVRAAFVWEGPSGALPASVSQTYTLRPDQKSKTDVVSFRGETNVGALELDYAAGWTGGKSDTPFRSMSVGQLSALGPFASLDRSHLSDQALGNTIDGRIVSLFAPSTGESFLVPLLSDSGFALINDPSRYRLRTGTIRENQGENTRYTASVGAKYNFQNSVIKYIEVGAFYERNRASSTSDFDITSFSFNAPLSTLGLAFSDTDLSRIGRVGRFNVIDQNAASDFLRNAENNPRAVLTVLDDAFGAFDDRVTEENLAAYIQTRLEFGKFELVGGVRVERVRATNRTVSGPQIVDEFGENDLPFYEANLGIVDLSGGQVDVLPRATFNFRPTENIVVRAGYYRSIARGALRDIGGPADITLFLSPQYGPTGNQPQLVLSFGNPNLKPAVTDNLDLSLEWYSNSIGVLKAAAFYKPTRNSIFQTASQSSSFLDEIELPDDPRFQNLPSNIFISSSRPENSPELTKLWGLEFSVERRFDFLPGLLAGFGVYANYTHTNGRRTNRIFFEFAPDQVVTVRAPYLTQPKDSGTFALTYSKAGLDATLGYTKQSRYSLLGTSDNLDLYKDALSTLDFKASYQFRGLGDMRIFVEGSNLLKGPNDASTRDSQGGVNGSPLVIRSSQFLGGRSVRIGIASSF